MTEWQRRSWEKFDRSLREEAAIRDALAAQGAQNRRLGCYAFFLQIFPGLPLEGIDRLSDLYLTYPKDPERYA